MARINFGRHHLTNLRDHGRGAALPGDIPERIDALLAQIKTMHDRIEAAKNSDPGTAAPLLLGELTPLEALSETHVPSRAFRRHIRRYRKGYGPRPLNGQHR